MSKSGRGLTQKQQAVAEYMKDHPADTNREIADAFHNSPLTIKSHIREICIAYGVETKRELVKELNNK